MLSGGGYYANSHQECVVEAGSLVCVSPVTGAFTGLGCPPSIPGGTLAVYRYTPSTGACQLDWRMPGGEAAIYGVSRSAAGSLRFVGMSSSAPADFGSGFTLGAGAHVWVGGISGGAVTFLEASELGAQLVRPAAIVPSESGVLVLGKTGPLQPGPSFPFFGIPLTVNDSAYVLTFNDLGQIVRRWPLLGGAANHEEIRNGTMTRVGDDIVVALMGSGYTFRGQPLAPDLQPRLFILVFRE
ncbi:MAG: hypothetical protein AMXMBFR34_47970 [Myxococcaceae bacterium]